MTTPSTPQSFDDAVVIKNTVLRKITTKPPNCTEFSPHVSTFLTDRSQFIDWTEKKLVRMIIESSGDISRQSELQHLLRMYVAGEVAIAWDSGTKPLFIKTPAKSLKSSTT